MMASGLFFVRTKSEKQVSKFATFLGHCTLISTLVACGGGGGTPPSGTSTPVDIILTPPAHSIQVGQTTQFVATATDANGNPIPEVPFTWTSSDPAVASVTSNGLVTGLLVASTTITATSGTVSSNASTLTVTPSNVGSITLTPPAPSIQVGQTQQFVATDANGNPIPGVTFTWTSSSSAVASISSTGLATGLSGGTTAITASAGGVTSSEVQLRVTTGARVYTTNFPLTENPISEGGNWINGKTVGLDWSDFQSTTNLAYGKQTGVSLTVYDDSIALLAGTWGANQTVQATIKTVGQTDAFVEELEIRLRSSIMPHSSTGYEINYAARCSVNSYLEVVKWNGPIGSFTILGRNSGTAVCLHDGDTIKASIIGGVITAYINGVQKVQITDNTFTSGSPGIGHFLFSATGVNSDYGFTSVTASD